MPTRPIVFWIATLAAVTAIVVLLRGVLLPFVAGAALAYLLNPIIGRIEKLGINRLLATLAVLVTVVVVIAILMVLAIPLIVSKIAYFIESLPLYLRKLQTLTTDESRPWLSKMVGEGLAEAERAVGELTALVSSSLGSFVRSIWSGGEALISFLSLAVVTPIVACYLIYDWDRMIVAIDHWIPPARRDTVRALASEIDCAFRRSRPSIPTDRDHLFRLIATRAGRGAEGAVG
jgi:predicted PurR-regulated permease PerM